MTSQLLIVLACCIAATLAGVVTHTRCGGVGTCRTVRCDNCEGPICYVNPGMPKSCSVDLIPSASASELRLVVTAIYLGLTVPIIDAVLPQSSVQPGFMYSIAYAITPNEIMEGNTIRLQAELINDGRDILECCVAVQIHVN